MTTTMTKTDELFIDQEFSELIPAPSQGELEQLETNLRQHGCIDDLVAWDNGVSLVLLDGHTRKRLCEKHGIPFRVRGLEFQNRNAARNWIINHQLGRRNLTEGQRRHLIGKLYLDERPGKGRPPKSATVADLSASKVAEMHGVSERTVHNAKDFTTSVDSIGERSPELKQAILNGKLKASATDLVALAASSPSVIGTAVRLANAGDAKAIKKALNTPQEREPGDDTDAIRAERERSRNNGREKVSPKDRKAAIAAFGVIVRYFSKLGVSNKYYDHLEAIRLVVESSLS